jgi:hypothetical protein
MTVLGVADRSELESRVRAIRAGDVAVLVAQASEEWDGDGEPYVRLLVHLSDPQGETWSDESFDDMGRQVDEIVATLPGYPDVRTLFTGGQSPPDEGPPPAEEVDEG